jgi:hypothetical protein
VLLSENIVPVKNLLDAEPVKTIPSKVATTHCRYSFFPIEIEIDYPSLGFPPPEFVDLPA